MSAKLYLLDSSLVVAPGATSVVIAGAGRSVMLHSIVPLRFDPDGLGAFHSRYRVVGIDAAGNDIDDAWGYYRHGTNTNPATPGAASKSQPFSQYIKSVGHNGLKVYIDRYADGGPMYLAIIAEVLT